MKMGNIVNLFHSSNVPAQKEIAAGDVLKVYRNVTQSSQAKGAPTREEIEVGEVKVLSFLVSIISKLESLKVK